MIQKNYFKGKISLQYKNQVTRLHGNPPSLSPAVMERYVEQRVLTNCREVKAWGAVREHLRGHSCSLLGPVSGTRSQNQAAWEKCRRTYKSMHSHRASTSQRLQGHDGITHNWNAAVYGYRPFRKDRLGRQIISKTLYQTGT